MTKKNLEMTSMRPEISIVAPMHNEEGNVRPLYQAVKDTMERYSRPYEIIFVNDKSEDKTLGVFKAVKASDPVFHYCDLEENVGENWAMLAGVSRAQGNIIVTMDGDFQNDPQYIPALIAELEKGYRVVSGWRKDRKGGFFDRILPSVVANFLISLISGAQVHDCGCGLKAYRREVLEGKFVPKGFMNRFSPVIFGVKGSEFSEVEVSDRVRTYGKSHYGLKRIFIVFNDILVLPFVLRGPVKMRRVIFGSGLATLFFLIFFIFLPLPSGLRAAVLTILLLAFLAMASIYSNLGRFIEAKRMPRFKIKEFQ